MNRFKTEHNLFRNAGLRWYVFSYAVFLVGGFVILMTVHYGDVVLFINKYSRMEWDRPVDWITRLGLGSTAVIIALGFALYKLRYSLMMLFNLALVGVTTGIFKNLLFPNSARPLKYFDPEVFHRMVRLTDYNLMHSFPSGHSITIFAIMSLLAYFTGKKYAGVLFVFVALIVALTRLYLCQHFFVDVYVGSVLGLLCTFTTIWVGDYVVKLKNRYVFEYPVLLHRFQRSFTAFFW